MSLSVQVDNKGKEILILGSGPTQASGKHSLFIDVSEGNCVGKNLSY